MEAGSVFQAQDIQDGLRAHGVSEAHRVQILRVIRHVQLERRVRQSKERITSLFSARPDVEDISARLSWRTRWAATTYEFRRQQKELAAFLQPEEPKATRALQDPLIQIDLEGYIDGKGIKYIGKAALQEDGTWRCLANVGGSLCIVEVTLKPEVDTSSDPDPVM